MYTIQESTEYFAASYRREYAHKTVIYQNNGAKSTNKNVRE